MRAPVASAPRRFVQPQLATAVREAPVGEDWTFELKFDGYRIQAVYDRDGRKPVALYTRRGLDWTERFPAVAEALAETLGRAGKGSSNGDGAAARGAKRNGRSAVRSATLDGEIVVLDDKGRSSFRLLQQYLDRGRTGALVFVAFDLLTLDGTDLRDEPLAERRATLARLLGEKARSASAKVRLSDTLEGAGDRLLKAACRAGLEGLIAKRSGDPYRSGRSKSWVKVKCEQRQEFVVVGFTLPRGSRAGIGALLLGVHEEGARLRYAGAVGTGFSHQLLLDLRKQLEAMRVKTPPFPGGDEPSGAPRDAHWVRPELLAEVSFTEWTDDGLLRHPSFQGMREDKEARDIQRETPMHVAGITISSPDRVVYPELDLTKFDVARYYEGIAKRMLPHIADRPLSFLRCPDGRTKQCFFQKHMGTGLDESVGKVAIKSKDGTSKDYAYVSNAAGIVALVQFGVLEFHVWGCKRDDIEKPDRIVFDLDPDESIAWHTTLEAATVLRDRLTAVGLKSWPKTTGGKGVHVVVPIARRSTWDDVRAFARAFAEDLESEYPHDFVSGASKASRKGKIFIDWLRNGRGATWVAPWSTRAREGATVSVPMSWKALEALEAPAETTVATVKEQPPKSADPWAAMLRSRQSLGSSAKQLARTR